MAHSSSRRLISLFVILLAELIGLGQARSATQMSDRTLGQMVREFHLAEAAGKARRLEQARGLQTLVTPTAEDLQTGYDVKWYDIAIRVNDTTQRLYGAVTCLAEIVEDDVSRVAIDLYSNMTIHSVTMSSVQLSFSRESNVVTIDLDRAYDAGESVNLTVVYSGTPRQISPFGGFYWTWRGGERAIYSMSDPFFARTWWPCKDRMDDKPDSLSIHIEVDTSLYCASNGALDSIVSGPSGGTHIFHYTSHYPIATYLVSIAISPFVVWEQEYVSRDGQVTMPIVNHVFASEHGESLEGWSVVPGIIGVLASEFGEYPFLEDKYGHAMWTATGGLENQTVSSVPDGSDAYWDLLVRHELAHQWWGNMITHKSWHDIWLTEGWASYSEAVYKWATAGWPAYHSYMASMEIWSGGTVWCSDTTDVFDIFSLLTYHKAAWVIHMLRGVLGEARFAQGLEAYYNCEYKYSAVSTEDFINVWESAVQMDLDWFFEEWIYGEYYPSYQYSFMSEPTATDGYNTYLVIKQVQQTNPQSFRMPVDVFLDHESLAGDTVTLEVGQRRELFKFNQSSPVTGVELDPSNWVLKHVEYRPWEMYIVTLDEELSSGTVAEQYLDTIETRGGSGPPALSVTGGSLPPGLSISSEGIISGIPVTSGTFSFLAAAVDPVSGFSDQVQLAIEIKPEPCCVGRVGDPDAVGGDEPTVSDVSVLIDAKFITGTCDGVIACPAEADVNQSGGGDPTCEDITIGDIATLIDYLFITGPEAAMLLDCL